jgi:hypothetical protein
MEPGGHQKVNQRASISWIPGFRWHHGNRNSFTLEDDILCFCYVRVDFTRAITDCHGLARSIFRECQGVVGELDVVGSVRVRARAPSAAWRSAERLERASL